MIIDAIVVGAGPAGIAAVGALAARKLRVHWVDRAFRVGALARYASVPANTKLDVLMAGLENFVPQVAQASSASAVSRSLHSLDSTAHSLPLLDTTDPAPRGWTTLGRCADFFGCVTEDLLRLDGVSRSHARVHSLVESADERWTVRDGSGSELAAANTVVLAVGGAACSAPPDLWPSAWANGGRGGGLPRVLPAEGAFDAERLASLLRPTPHAVVGIIGGGHSGFVTAMALVERRVRTRLFLRRPVRLASWDADARAYGSWAFRGLKGAAAEFATRHGLVDQPPKNGALAGTTLEVYHADLLRTDAEVARMDAVFFNLGFEAAPMPRLVPAARPAASSDEPPRMRIGGHQSPGGRLLSEDGAVIRGLYGIGLGFADEEFSSGQPYGEVGFAPFTARAEEIAERIVRDADPR